MNTELMIPGNVVAAIKCFAATKDTRSRINGINISLRPDEIRLSATTGAIGAIYRAIIPVAVDKQVDYLIPNGLLNHVKRTGMVAINIGTEEIEGMAKGVRTVTIASNGLTVTGYSSEHIFPDLAAAIPRTVSGKVAQFDANLIKILHTARKALEGRDHGRLMIGHNGNDGALVDMGDDNLACVIMPLREERVPTMRPDWLN